MAAEQRHSTSCPALPRWLNRAASRRQTSEVESGLTGPTAKTARPCIRTLPGSENSTSPLRTSGMPTLAILGVVTPGLGAMVTAVVFPAF